MIRYLGSLAVRDVIGGVADVIEPLATAATSLTATLRQVSTLLLQARDFVRDLVALDWESQLAALDVTLDLPSPAAYLADLMAGIATLQADLLALVPTVALSAQLAASLDLIAGLKLKLEGLDAALAPLTAAAETLERAARLLADAVDAYTAFAADLAATGVHLFLYNGPLSRLGTELETEAIASSGLSGTTPVYAPLLLISTVDVAAIRAVNAAMRLP